MTKTVELYGKMIKLNLHVLYSDLTRVQTLIELYIESDSKPWTQLNGKLRMKLSPFLSQIIYIYIYKLKLNSVALVRERTIPTERPPPVGEVSANFCR